jgi:hypothetical protein
MFGQCGIFCFHFNYRQYVFGFVCNKGSEPGGGGRTRSAPPPKIGKNKIFWHKIVIFHTKYPKNFAHPPLKLEKIWLFGVKSWFFTRNTPTNFAPPSARRKLFNCAPLNLKSWIRPWVLLVEETGVPGENHPSVASHWQTLSHNVVHLALIKIRAHNISNKLEIYLFITNICMPPYEHGLISS